MDKKNIQYGELRNKIIEWFDTKKNIKNTINGFYNEFVKETNIQVSNMYFYMVVEYLVGKGILKELQAGKVRIVWRE